MSLKPADVVQKINAQASRVTQGEALVVLIESRQLHRLNPVATRVWELCDGRDVASIIARIVDEFAVEPEVASQDVCEFLEQLLQLGALQLGEPKA